MPNVIFAEKKMTRSMNRIYFRLVLSLTAAISLNMSAQDVDLNVNDTIDVHELNEVVVSARRPDAVVKADKISFNPSSTISGSVGSIFDTLNSIAGVNVDSNGGISVNGQEDITLTINGRKSILTREALLSFLKSEPAATVERIEVLSSPSAKNDASSSPIILNITTKKRRDTGVAAGFNATGLLWKTKRGLMNMFGGYSSEKVLLKVNYTFIAHRNPFLLFTQRPYSDEENGLLQECRRSRRDRIHNVSALLDYDISKTWKSGITFSTNLFNRHENADMDNRIPSKGNRTYSTTDMVSHYRNLHGNAYLTHNFADNNGYIDLGFDYFNFRTNDLQHMKSDEPAEVYGDMGGTSSGYVVSLDFLRKALGKWDLSAGAKSTRIFIENSGVYNGTLPDDMSASDNLDSSFNYQENVNALYTEATFSLKTFKSTIGLRAEQTNVWSKFSGNEATAKQNYSTHDIQLFPSIQISSVLGGRGHVMTSYSQRIVRPNYSDMNPYIYIFDDITHTCGNINLRPSLSHNFMTAYSHDSWLRFAFNFSMNKDAIVKCYREISDKIMYISPENIHQNLQASLTISAVNVSLTNWWTTSLNITGLYSKYYFDRHSGIKDNHKLTPILDCKNFFKLPTGWTAELSGKWRGRIAYGQATVYSVGSIYVGVKKSFWGGKAYISLFAKDLLNTNRLHSEVELSGKKGSLSEYDYETMRQIGMSFGASFTSGKFRSNKKNNPTLIDEIKRVNL